MTAADPVWRDLTARRYLPALLLACAGVWLHAADSLLVATMLPAIVADIGGDALVAWTVSLYQIGTIVSSCAGGLIAMRFGLRLPMAAFAGVFLVGCVVAALATGMWILLVGRLIQGVGGGGMIALAFVSISLVFPAALVPSALALVSAIWGTSAFLGPLIGGLFVEWLDWRSGFACFALQALGIVLWLVSSTPVPDRTGAQTLDTAFPVRTLALLALGVIAVASAGIEVDLVTTPLLVGLGVASLLGFLYIDVRRKDDRLLPVHSLRLSHPNGALLAMVLALAIATTPLLTHGPLFMVALHGTPALTAGYVVAGSSIGWSLAAIAAAQSPPSRDRQTIATGVVLVATSVAGFAYSVVNGPIWLVAAFAVLEGAGFGLAWTFILRQANRFAATGELERTSGALPTVQQLGYALGAAIVGIVANAAGFDTDGARVEQRAAAFAVFIGSLPFALFALYALVCFSRRSIALERP